MFDKKKSNSPGFLGSIDEEMADDMWSIKFDVIKEWQERMKSCPTGNNNYFFRFSHKRKKMGGRYVFLMLKHQNKNKWYYFLCKIYDAIIW